MRELLEQGYEVAVVKDATAAAQTSELGDGYASAVTNFGFMANIVWTTEEAVEAIKQAD
jgi:nicotinamidase-related amidase